MSGDLDKRARARALARVEKAIARGETRFILLRGMVGWGLPMFVIFTVLPAFRVVPWFAGVSSHPDVFVPVGALVWFGGGYFFGRWMWRAINRQYEELTGQSEE